MKISLVVALSMCITACACNSSTVPTSSKGDASQLVRREATPEDLKFGKDAGRQAVKLKWERPGKWIPGEAIAQDGGTTPILVARDKMGDRILVPLRNSGYAVQLVRTSCDMRTLTTLEAREASGDESDLDIRTKPSKSSYVMVPPDQVDNICRNQQKTAALTPANALKKLRMGMTANNDAPPPLSDERRRQLIEEYKARIGKN